MSSNELDLSVAPSAEQIRKREFATVRRGYDADQVRDYLRQVAEQITALERVAHDAKASTSAAETAASDNRAALQAALDRARVAERDAREAREQMEQAPAAPPEDPFGAFGEQMASLLRDAETQAAEIRNGAEMESRRSEMDARAEADRITTDAQSRAEELRTEAQGVMDRAQEEADRLLAGLFSKKEALKGDLEHMRERLLAMAQSLESLAGSGPADTLPASADMDAAGLGLDTADDGDSAEVGSQLHELWADEERLLPEAVALADQIDETMAGFTIETDSLTVDEPVTEGPPALPPGAPFFVDETTPADEDPDAPGLYPR